jgi:hypothetical protein
MIPIPWGAIIDILTEMERIDLPEKCVMKFGIINGRDEEGIVHTLWYFDHIPQVIPIAFE